MLKIEECQVYFDYIKNQLDPKWIENQYALLEKYFSTPKNTQILGPLENYHPFGRLLFNVEKNLERIKKDNKIPPSEEILKVAKIGQTVDFLKKSNVKGLDSKIKELTSTNHAQFEKTLYELDVGKMFAKNHKIEFLEINSKKSPDLLIDEKIELECKKKDKKSKEQKIQEVFFKQLVDQSHKYIRDTNEGFVITITTTKALNKNKIKKFISNLISLIKNKKEGTFSYVEGKITLKKIIDKDQKLLLKGEFPSIHHVSTDLMFNVTKQIIEQKFGKEFWHKIISDNKHFDARTKLTHFQNKTVALQTLDFFILDSPFFPTKNESIILSIKKAKKQLSRTRAGIIFVDMDYHPETVSEDFLQITPLIQKILEQNQSISLVVITANIHLKENGKLVYYYDGKSFFNKHAKFPISQDYDLFTNKASPIYSSPTDMPSAPAKESDSAVFSYVCIGCRNKIFVQANFEHMIPLLENYVYFPSSNILKCPHCNLSKDLSESRKLIEESTGKKII